MLLVVFESARSCVAKFNGSPNAEHAPPALSLCHEELRIGERAQLFRNLTRTLRVWRKSEFVDFYSQQEVGHILFSAPR
jgi:hypothetical protein